jgi:hypothetical protein
MARVLADGKFEPQVYWRTGMLLAWVRTTSCRVVSCRVRLCAVVCAVCRAMSVDLLFAALQRKRSSRRGKEEKILVEIFPKENRISIQVRKHTNMNWLSGKAKDEASSMVVIIHTLDALVEDWYQTKKMVPSHTHHRTRTRRALHTGTQHAR